MEVGSEWPCIITSKSVTCIRNTFRYSACLDFYLQQGQSVISSSILKHRVIRTRLYMYVYYTITITNILVRIFWGWAISGKFDGLLVVICACSMCAWKRITKFYIHYCIPILTERIIWSEVSSVSASQNFLL